MELDRRVLYGCLTAAVTAATVLAPESVESLPTACAFRRVTGLPCPGCGLTRSWVLTAHGRFGQRQSVIRSARRPSWSRCCWCCAVRAPFPSPACPVAAAGADGLGGRVARLGARPHGQGRRSEPHALGCPHAADRHVLHHASTASWRRRASTSIADGRNAWALRVQDEETEQYNIDLVRGPMQSSSGRTTYQIWAAFWPTARRPTALVDRRMNDDPEVRRLEHAGAGRLEQHHHPARRRGGRDHAAQGATRRRAPHLRQRRPARRAHEAQPRRRVPAAALSRSCWAAASTCSGTGSTRSTCA